MLAPLTRPETFPEYQAMYGSIFGPANAPIPSDRKVSMLAQTTILGVQKNARKSRTEAFLEQLPNVVSRTFAIANHFSIDVESAMRFKFPGVCMYCLESDGCRCLFKKTAEKGSTP